MNDYLTTDLVGSLSEIKFVGIMNDSYRHFKKIQCDNVYFLINIQDINQIEPLQDHHENILISFHTENFDILTLIDFFNQYPSKNFLLLNDSDLHENFWPANVTYVKWITWGDQIANAIKFHGIAEKYTAKKLKLSSLSFRKTWHRAAVTGFLSQNFNTNEIVVSWHNQRFAYEEDLPDSIKQYTDFINNTVITNFDTFSEEDNSPIKNGKWQHIPYLDCVFNLTNESFFNSHTIIDKNIIAIPTPYLTEKTWKPLLAGQALIPVGQFGTLKNLSNLGLSFDYGIDLSHDDCINDFDRMNKIFNLLETIKYSSITELENNILTATEHNLNIVKSEQFKKNCETINLENFEKIKQWIDQAHSA